MPSPRSTRTPSSPRLTKTKPPRLARSEEHTSELQSRQYIVCRLLLEKKKKNGSQLIPVIYDAMRAFHAVGLTDSITFVEITVSRIVVGLGARLLTCAIAVLIGSHASK